MMRIKDFYEILEHDTDPDISILPILENLINRFPIFQAGIFIYLKCLYLTDSPKFNPELTRLTPFIHDRRALFYYILKAIYIKFKIKGKDSTQLQDRTSILINSFFDALGNDNNELLENVVENTSMVSLDYFSFIDNTKLDSADNDKYLKEDPRLDSKVKSQDLIDKLISESDELTSNILPNLNAAVSLSTYNTDESTEEDDSIEDRQEEDFFFTQTLVDVYIKQKKYDRAYEIIKRLNLNNPEKNIYFAERLSFLEKQIKIPNNK